jgi:hypothetical protein
MPISQKIRLSMAIVLLCAFFLPLSQCSHGPEAKDLRTPQAYSHARHLFPRSDNEFRYQYAIEAIDFSLIGVLTLVAFSWPLAFAIWRRRFRPHRFWWIFYAVELLLSAGTAYWVYALTQGGRWLYGAYIGEVAITIYAGITLILMAGRIRDRRAAVSLTTGPLQGSSSGT